eukprot:TRINITY_DN28846_c0_g1_i1.p1 TRINITY_DN28846_c0_g1~~TRINITY_DN28846_c0_g1_i1.p1  ORF type:complete len:115 (+),score=7.88 TRINITY_DN28846_c0_g1_i1:34-345(+)
MISSNEVIELIKGFSLKERLLIIEEILRNIREENATSSPDDKNSPAILDLAGVIDAQEAEVFNSAISESRQVDEDEWQILIRFQYYHRYLQRRLQYYRQNKNY